MLEGNEINKQNRIKPSRLPKIYFVIFLLFITAVYFFGSTVWMMLNTKGYQSVFMDNGQVYFGKLSTSGGYLKLTDVYYLQATQNLQQGVTLDQNKSPKVELIKLGGELHGPTDTMYLERSKMMFWENMREDSKVVEAIKQNK
jgi:hypothetical protein